MNELDKAIDILGGVQATADKFNLTDMAIRQWRDRGVPLKHSFTLERLTNGQVKKELLCPEIFGDTAA